MKLIIESTVDYMPISDLFMDRLVLGATKLSQMLECLDNVASSKVRYLLKEDQKKFSQDIKKGIKGIKMRVLGILEAVLAKFDNRGSYLEAKLLSFSEMLINMIKNTEDLEILQKSVFFAEKLSERMEDPFRKSMLLQGIQHAQAEKYLDMNRENLDNFNIDKNESDRKSKFLIQKLKKTFQKKKLEITQEDASEFRRSSFGIFPKFIFLHFS